MRSRINSSASQFTKQQNTRRIIHKLHKCHYKLLLVNTVDFIHVFYDYKFTIYVSDSQHSATMSMERDPMKDDPSVIKVRGLPWEATAMDLCKFFRDCDIVGGPNGIHFCTNDRGQPSGEAFIEMERPEDVEKALEKHKQNMGRR